jgi:hypothetical protein
MIFQAASSDKQLDLIPLEVGEVDVGGGMKIGIQVELSCSLHNDNERSACVTISVWN